ncbi:hypothetical protein BDQ17DRAFT_1192960, partial [Cyathus striatus]
GIPDILVEWLCIVLEGCYTSLSFDDHLSDLFCLMGGLDQGNPFSPILYILYNSGLLAASAGADLLLLYLDDSAMLILSSFIQKNHCAMATIMTQPGGVFDWAAEHNYEFGVDKFQL